MSDIGPDAAGKSGQAPVVLVVEDEVMIRLLLAENLREEGYAVLEAADAVEALVLFSSDLSLDLVLTDVRMPGDLDGIKLTRIIKEAKPDLPVAILSAHLDASEEHAADAFLRKPYAYDALLKLVSELIDHRCPSRKTNQAS